MINDFEMIKNFYHNYTNKIKEIRNVLQRPLTLSEKILYSHLYNSNEAKPFNRAVDYVNFKPDRVAMQDATAQMAILQFINSKQLETAVPTTVHCDHLIQAYKDATSDLATAIDKNKEVYDFLESASKKFGIGFWKPGSGIIHQIILENYAFPGGMLIGTDSHTVNAGGLGMIAIGVGGADAVDVMTNIPWELKIPKIIGVKLIGKLSGWCSAKDIILKLAGILSVKGGTGCIIEYFGEGAESLSATGKATICNMGAEVGATTSIFGYDDAMQRYLIATNRADLIHLIDKIKDELKADKEVLENPSKYYDKIIEIDLNKLEPYINGPYTPDAAYPVSEFAKIVKENNYPENLEVGLIGSCTNSSYEDLARSVSILKDAKQNNLQVKSKLVINPGSEKIRKTAERDGIIKTFQEANAIIMTNACGPCIGQWNRETTDNNRKNSIINSFNRNFAKRNDGNPNTHSFVASPEIVTALSIAGKITFNPLKDSLLNENNELVKLKEPKGEELPVNGFEKEENVFIKPSKDYKEIPIVIDEKSDRLQILEPFSQNKVEDYQNLNLLIKVKGKCTTDHISMAGTWLKYRGHLDNISNNLLIGATNAFTNEVNKVKLPNSSINEYMQVPELARYYKNKNIFSMVIGEENFGEGSSREHAAMELRHLNVKVVLAKSFARIHETNLKKQGVLPLTFDNNDDYDKIYQSAIFKILNISELKEGEKLKIKVQNFDEEIIILANHTLNNNQIKWFWAGSALNHLQNDKY